jgi:hypothetical protein
MSAALRLLFTRGQHLATWRAGFDLAQAAAALDVPLELGFASAGVKLIVPSATETEVVAGSGIWASLTLLGVEYAYAPASCCIGLAPDRAALPVRWLDASDWRAWLRRAPLQAW